MGEHWINLLWRIPIAAFCFTLACYLGRWLIELINGDKGFSFELLGAIYGGTLCVLMPLLIGFMTLSPRSPTLARAFFSAAADSVAKHLEHWNG